MPFQKGNQLSGSRKGKPNRIKRDAREATALFVNRNMSKLQRWLNRVADGHREPDQIGPDGKVILPGKWIVKPDPARAFDMLMSVVEYHIPKLSRQEIVKPPNGPPRIIDSSQLTFEQREQLRLLLAQSDPALIEQPKANVLEPAGLGEAQVVESMDDSE